MNIHGIVASFAEDLLKEEGMGMITCPACNKQFDTDDKRCPYCGYPYEFLVEKQKKDKYVYSRKFFKGIAEHDRYLAVRSLGVLEYLNLSDLDGLYAIINIEDGHYDVAEKQLKKCSAKAEGPFKSLYLGKLFECYALQGKLVEVQTLIQENKNILSDYWLINYWAILATKNMNVKQYVNYLIAKENGDINDDISVLEKGVMHNEEVKNKIKDLLAEIFVELIVMLRGLVRAHDISKGTSVISLEENNRPGILKAALSYSGMLFGQEYELIPLVDEIYHLSGYENAGGDDYNIVCNKAATMLHRLMFNERDVLPEQTIKYILYLIKIDALDKAKRKAIREAQTVYNLLLEDKKDAIEVLVGLDTHELIDESNRVLYEYKERVLMKNRGYVEHVFEQQVYNKLSTRGVYAFQVAEWAFDKAREEDYSWKDAGPLSLNYFRIIELELNLKMIVPIVSGNQYKQLSKVYKKERDALNEEQKEVFKNRWESFMMCFKRINKPTDPTDGLELGPLNRFISNIIIKDSSEYQVGDTTASFLYGKVSQQMTERGKEALVSGEILDIISDTNREKYRNPPAHTRYLPFTTAYECRDFVIKSLHRISEWFIA